jgi:transposase InsO family protein
VVAFIDAHRDNTTGGCRWGVEPICEVLQVAPSTCYDSKSRPPSVRAVRDAVLIPVPVAIWTHSYSVYGQRKLTKAARKAGYDLGRDQVARLMAAAEIRGVSRAKNRFTTKADPAALRAPDLVKRNFVATRPDQLWVADFTYCSTWSGIVYGLRHRRVLAADRGLESGMLDGSQPGDRRVEHGRLDPPPQRPGRSRMPLRRGKRYTSIAYTDRLDDIGAAPSIGTIADSYDDAMAESVNALFKTELYRNPAVLARVGGHWKGLDDLEVETCGSVGWFNTERIHGELDDLTPEEAETAYYAFNPAISPALDNDRRAS